MARNGFDVFKVDKSLVGKNLADIEDSKVGRNQLVSIFGGTENLPSSVMQAKRPRVREETDEPTAKRSYDTTAPGIEKSKDPRIPYALREAFYISGRGTQNGALSTFPQTVGRTMVLFYSDPGDVVFDPFAGHNSRMELCVKTGRHYIGCDVSTEFMAFNFKRAKALQEQYPEARIELYHGDSRSVPVAKRTGDFTITSPPYWDIEDYGDEPEQLGKAKTYSAFLDGLQQVLRENYRVLKRGAYAVWFINDFRRKKKFHLYHADVARLGETVGFRVHDLLVVDFGRSIRDCFTNQAITTKILPKHHEFGIVFYKPELKKGV